MGMMDKIIEALTGESEEKKAALRAEEERREKDKKVKLVSSEELDAELLGMMNKGKR